MKTQWIVVNSNTAVGPFPSEVAASDFIASRPNAGYSILPLLKPGRFI